MNTTPNIHVCIMAGGAGTRFWPMSTEKKPKQFLNLIHKHQSLLQQTYARATRLTGSDKIWIMTNERYKDLVIQQLPEINSGQILCEPMRKDTAPAIAYAAFRLRKTDPDSIMVVLSSDHHIIKDDIFSDAINQAVHHSATYDSLVTLGIRPDTPHTGYGYIQFDKAASPPFYPVKKFVEKPDSNTAEEYLKEGNFLWNAGIFIWSVKRICKEFSKYADSIYKSFSSIEDDFLTSRENQSVKKAFETSISISIDFAIMEKADNIFTIPVDVGWSDLGTWSALYSLRAKDDNRNVIVGKGNALISSSMGNIILIPEGKKALIRGLEDYIVVLNEEGLLIYPRQDEQRIKSDLQELKNRI